MHVCDVEIVLPWRLVLLRAEAHEPLFVNEHTQRVAREHRDVDPQVELVPVDQKRAREVLLSDNVVIAEVLQRLQSDVGGLRERDALALAAGVGFQNERPPFLKEGRVGRSAGKDKM